MGYPINGDFFMLLDLEILNGELSPVFDIYNDVYSVTINEDTTSLVMDYEVEDGYVVNIIDNTGLEAGENEVYIQVIKDEEINTYTLLVYKESSEPVFNYEYIPEGVEVEEELPEYVAPLIIGSCLLVILIVFLLLFKRKS